ncbi:MAG TPA: aldose epimerase [Opitutus sp.]|nr:aldose epimerase [Opitutus sp.]
MDTVAYQGQTLTRWRVGSSTFLALPERGARLMNWHVTHGDGSVRDVLYWPEQADFADIAKVRGGNPILFPFNGRVFDQGEIFFWRADDGVRRPMPMHGLARQGVFKTVWSDARGFAAQFIPDEEARAAYPFDYEFTVTYRFEPLGFTCEFNLKNLGNVPLPWSAGHHFYFTLPWSEGLQRSDYAVRIPAGEHLRQDGAGQLVAGPKLPLESNLAEPGLIDTLHTKLRGNEAVVTERGRGGRIAVRLGTAKTPPADATFVTWTSDEKAPYFCVEPWMGPPNAPGHQRGLQRVPPLETGTFTVTVSIE